MNWLGWNKHRRGLDGGQNSLNNINAQHHRTRHFNALTDIRNKTWTGILWIINLVALDILVPRLIDGFDSPENLETYESNSRHYPNGYIYKLKQTKLMKPMGDACGLWRLRAQRSTKTCHGARAKILLCPPQRAKPGNGVTFLCVFSMMVIMYEYSMYIYICVYIYVYIHINV